MSGPIQCNIKTSETRSRWCLCVLIQTRHVDLLAADQGTQTFTPNSKQ